MLEKASILLTVQTVNSVFSSLTADVIDMRLSKHLHPKEVETVAKKKAICRDAISKLLGKDISPDKVSFFFHFSCIFLISFV